MSLLSYRNMNSQDKRADGPRPLGQAWIQADGAEKLGLRAPITPLPGFTHLNRGATRNATSPGLCLPAASAHWARPTVLS